MAVSFASYEIARSGLFVNERGLYVTGHNISNVNTPGYVRQQAMITTGPYQNESKYQLGLGADIEQIRQIRHSFLDNIYRQENTTLGYWEAKNKTYQDVQAVLGEPMGAGLQSVMNQFWDSWQELSKEPESLTVRALVRQRAESMVQQVNHIGSQLDKLQKDLDSEIRVRIDEINQATEQIAMLNAEILKMEVSGDTANDYRDQRNVMLDKLCKLANVEITEMQNGQVDITLGGYFLVTRGQQTRLYADEGQAGSLFCVPKIEGTNIEVPIRSGTLKGLMESRGEVSGATDSISNGSPYTKADITFAIDLSSSNAENLSKVKENIDKYLKEISTKGVDFNLRLVTYSTAGTAVSTVYTSSASDIAAFKTALTGLSASESGTGVFSGTTGLASELSGITYRPDANRYAVVFTSESVDGTASLDASGLAGCVKVLKDSGVKTSVVTDIKYHNTGQDSAEAGWSSITGATGGRIYDMDADDFGSLMGTIGLNNVNVGIGMVSGTTNIISDVRKQLNALVNTIAREVNFMHRNGKTLTGQDGGDFFVPINDAYPMQMGNIKLNDDPATGITNLNNIVASASGASGDNTIAARIANLRNMPEMQDINGTLDMDGYYQSIILNIGNGGSNAQNITDNQQKLVISADNNRQSIAGVSMDEEMSNMMKYKFAYDASSRAINVIDEMMETIITRMGLAGR